MSELLEVKNLRTVFHTMRGTNTAVDGVSFQVHKGEILGIVGESGCGKSVTSQSIMRLYDEKKLVTYSGEILFKEKDLLKLAEKDMADIRGNQIAMIFQDALSSLNPVLSVGNQIMEAICTHNQSVTKEAAREKAVSLLRLTGIPAPEQRVDSYPHEMSGGMRQRAMIAMALACEPSLLIADEPTTALDVTIQAQILDLITDLHEKLNTGVILITHDLGVVAQVCSRIIVMYLGQIIENGLVNDIFSTPIHPYTNGLMKSIPTLSTDRNEDLYQIDGSVPRLDNVGEGCRFYDRCPYAEPYCKDNPPPKVELENGHYAFCWRPCNGSAPPYGERSTL